MRSLVERVAAPPAPACDVDYAAGAAGGQRPARGRPAARGRAGDRAARRASPSPQSIGGEDFGWFADVCRARSPGSARRRRAALDLHRGPSTSTSGRMGVGVRLLARTALHALEADSAPPRTGKTPRPATLIRPTVDERRGPDHEISGSAEPTAAPADAEVPAEHEVPDDLVLAAEFPPATRDQWRDLVAGVLRKAGREDLPDPVEEALRATVATGVSVAPLNTAEDAGEARRN